MWAERAVERRSYPLAPSKPTVLSNFLHRGDAVASPPTHPLIQIPLYSFCSIFLNFYSV